MLHELIKHQHLTGSCDFGRTGNINNDLLIGGAA
jgi:hypothetical protein